MNLYCLTALVALLMMLNAHDEHRKRRAIFIDQELVTTVDQRPAHASAEVFFTTKKDN